ncbi:hypothetical protein OEA41_007182 [Lepraria neglecta]|uniref:SET domain-containing protein n=1 Tax=Lepraria neglecta TaxID=209136 RepID=A0AAE0DQA2_9LECA|nr:hypothetical protein OEA41_007182 [Lepraria neglecta]
MDAEIPSTTATAPNVFITFSFNSPTGYGTIAAREIPRGKRIFADECLFGVLDYQNRARVQGKYGKLPIEKKRIFDQLASQGHDVLAAFQTNALVYNDRCTMYGIFPQAAGLNHSCQPNAYFSWNAKLQFGTTHAIRDIPRGSEISISYCDPLLSIDGRKEVLARYSFPCVCNICSDLDHGSERRRSEIRRLKSEISRTRRHCPVTLLDLIMLIDLIEEEGLVSLDLANYYRHAAECCRATKQYKEALRFGRKTLEVVETCVGSDSPVFDATKQFVQGLEEAEREVKSK